MTTPRRRVIALALACSAVAAACGEDASQPFTTPNATMRDGLSVLPLSDVAQGNVAITINDYTAAAAAMDVDPPPDAAGPGEARDWIDQLFGGRLDLRIPAFLSGASLTMPELAESEFGWSPYDVEVSAELMPLGSDDVGRFTVLLGDLEWANDADLGDGVGTIGIGPDGERVEDDRTELRPLGRPLRTGARNGLIAAGFATDQMRAWIDGDFDDARSDARLLSAAERLDAVDAYTANMVLGDFDIDTMDATQGADARPDIPLDEPFDALAIGLSGEFAELTSTIVYVFTDQSAAKRANDQINERWRELDLSGLDGTFEIETIEQRGDAVVVISRVEDGRIASDVVHVASAAGLFVHA